MPAINRTWSRHRILAEIKDRGFTTIKLDAKLGLKPNDIAVSLNRPFPKADKALAKWLKLPLHELWPDRYYSNGTRRVQQSYPNRKIMTAYSKMGEAA
ncbi:MAG: helix-turn-helix domain-containing protein [Rhizobiales bacterium]|nr:helix-turn-helix domain-containing protein [Hyphomicrobiales bacterium]